MNAYLVLRAGVMPPIVSDTGVPVAPETSPQLELWGS